MNSEYDLQDKSVDELEEMLQKVQEKLFLHLVEKGYNAAENDVPLENVKEDVAEDISLSAYQDD